MKIAVIGTGIAGNVAARRLHDAGHKLTVFEAADHIGGHSHTHEIDDRGNRLALDTGFIVFNERTYPHFLALLAELGVAAQPSSMSFSVRNERTGLEYNGTSVNALFAQRRNFFRPSFHRMILDILRFNRQAPSLLGGDDPCTLAEYVEKNAYSRSFVDQYLVPMGAAIWSTDPVRMLGFPAHFFVRFLANHGMLRVNDRPQWRTIAGGSARYVEKLVAPFRARIRLCTAVELVRRLPDCVLVKARGGGVERFDQAFLACHSDQALRLLDDATALERQIVGAFPYQENELVLHTDTRMLPVARRAWAAWNYHVPRVPGERVALTYNLNILQRLDASRTYCATLNRTAEIDPASILKRIVYHHPLFTQEAVAAQRRQREVNGVRRTYFCGAYWGFGFHEDGVQSAQAALAHFAATHHAQRDLSRVA